MTDEMKILMDIQKQVSDVRATQSGMASDVSALAKSVAIHNKEIFGNGAKGLKAKVEGISVRVGIYAAAGVFVGSTITAIVLQAMVKRAIGAG